MSIHFKEQLINVAQRYWSDNYSLHLSNYNYDGTYDDLTDLVFTRRKDGYPTESDGIVLSEEAVHKLMDKLWVLGIRPSKDISSTGQAEALLEHIKTLREQNLYLQSIINELLRNGKE